MDVAVIRPFDGRVVIGGFFGEVNGGTEFFRSRNVG
jgi:hypothetical protein